VKHAVVAFRYEQCLRRRGVQNVRAGVIAATSQQYPLKMASLGVAAVVNLITGKPAAGVPSKSVAFVIANCWG
jgi:fructose transport system substrate-binding protein